MRIDRYIVPRQLGEGPTLASNPELIPGVALVVASLVGAGLVFAWLAAGGGNALERAPVAARMSNRRSR
jgi:hypothetical protein